MTITRSQVESWRPSELRSAASALRTTDEFRNRLDRVVSTMTESSEYWSGRAYDAALDRAHDERTGGTRVADAVHEVAEALEHGESSLSKRRRRRRVDRSRRGAAVDARRRRARANGNALADDPDSEMLARVAADLHDLGLDQASLDRMLRGEPISTLPQATQDYYRELYRAAAGIQHHWWPKVHAGRRPGHLRHPPRGFRSQS
ncbi:WXG100 family type VII secretion target [Prescottella agglutinans]|uniref:WXG100 family type VII secretion target n=1 Tax=Prescottella agglutinans TaxID=1644129 RepID=UPI003D95ED14